MKSLLPEGLGNWWGHTDPTKPGFYVYGGINKPWDSTSVGVIDSHPYLVYSGWDAGLITCTVFTDNNGYATTGWPFRLGAVGGGNVIRATVYNTNLSLTFQSIASSQSVPPPQLDPDYPTMTADQTPNLFGTVSSAYAGYDVNIYYNGELIATTKVRSYGYWSIELPFLPDGTYYFSIQLVNPYLDNYSAYQTVSLTIDTTSPVITINKPEEGITISSLSQIFCDISYSDTGSGVNINTLEISLNNNPITQVFEIIPTGASYYPAFDTQEEIDKCLTVYQASLVGPNELVVRMRDNVGTLQEVTRHFTVVTETIYVPFASGQHLNAWFEPTGWDTIQINVIKTPNPYQLSEIGDDNYEEVGDITQGTLTISYTDIYSEPVEIERIITVNNISREISYEGLPVTTLGAIFGTLPSPPSVATMNLSMGFSHPLTVHIFPVFGCVQDPPRYYTDNGTEITTTNGHATPTSEVIQARESWYTLNGVTPITKVMEADGSYNCHGWTFACGQRWIDDPAEVEKILRENKYTKLGDNEEVRKYDVVVYRNAQGKILHTGVVTAVNNGIATQVTSKWGDGRGYEHVPQTVSPNYRPDGLIIEYWHTDRNDLQSKDRNTLSKCGCIGLEAIILLFIIRLLKRRKLNTKKLQDAGITLIKETKETQLASYQSSKTLILPFIAFVLIIVSCTRKDYINMDYWETEKDEISKRTREVLNSADNEMIRKINEVLDKVKTAEFFRTTPGGLADASSFQYLWWGLLKTPEGQFLIQNSALSVPVMIQCLSAPKEIIVSPLLNDEARALIIYSLVFSKTKSIDSIPFLVVSINSVPSGEKIYMDHPALFALSVIAHITEQDISRCNDPSFSDRHKIIQDALNWYKKHKGNEPK
jgi:hypothetical protein